MTVLVFGFRQSEENGKYYCAEVVSIMIPYDTFVQYSNDASNKVSPEI
jgi:hypothetical protein